MVEHCWTSNLKHWTSLEHSWMQLLNMVFLRKEVAFYIRHVLMSTLIKVTYRLHLRWTLTYIHPKIVIREFIWQLTTSFWTMKNLASYIQKLLTVNEKTLLPFQLTLSYQLNAWKYMEDWQFTKGMGLFEYFGKEIHWSNSTFFNQ